MSFEEHANVQHKKGDRCRTQDLKETLELINSMKIIRIWSPREGGDEERIRNTYVLNLN